MLLLLTAGAFLMPLLAERIGWFVAPCEMLYGTVVANFVPGADQPGAFILTLSQFGFLLLLFLAGLEIDFDLIQRRGARMVLRAGLAAAGIQILAAGFGLLAHWPPVYVLLLGALSVSVLLVVLQQDNMSQRPFGQTMLIVGAIGEFLSILELTAYDLISHHGLGWPLAIAALKLLALLVLGYIALRGLIWIIAQQLHHKWRWFARYHPSEVGVRAAFALMLCFAAAAVWLGVEQILATFIAGAVYSFAFRRRTVVAEKLTTIGQSFFVPVFFITVGLGLRLGDFVRGPALATVAGLTLSLLLVRVLAIPVLRLAGLKWSATLPGTLLLAAPLTLQVAVVQVGIDLGQVGAQTRGVALGAAIVGAVLFPLLARPLMPTTRARRAASATGQAPVEAVRTRARVAFQRARTRFARQLGNSPHESAPRSPVPPATRR